MRVRAILAVLLMLAAMPLAAQAPLAAQGSRGDLDWMTGQWSGSGRMFGRPSVTRLTVAPAIGKSWVQLDYSAEVAAAGNAPPIRFDGRGHYRATADSKWTGRWLDSAGSSHPVAGRVSGRTFVTLWGSVDSELGRSRYALGPDGQLTVTDSVLQADGTWRDFATATYRREPG